ncbi:UPF0361 protein yoqW [Thecamonas trahens ATCC 50062]|uniref:UPF0361 protein yoqW n=1 Tax=Thecamonas trahens ATCC 50062 TaxID=461836 RepID=A0A0L0DJM4_THETB|nr:UPF0361 protein yoqW [Thecamonas trahens ATCC 50062]KNC52604.1 UPF0361 protein yoqW [Thecamonas trahens ATCC 50062]|eukprot:XP_013755163.1 UPF0361 protein yoqW [Thecamonas trahens ATCC 50062]
MCGRTSMTKTADALERATGRRWRSQAAAERLRPSANVAPGTPLPVVQAMRGEGSGEVIDSVLTTMRWGFERPEWSSPVINVRAETMLARPLFASPLVSGRCVVAVEGFYEWDATKNPHYISLSDHGVMYMAALYEAIPGPDGALSYAVAVVTVAAAEDISWLHDRMPALLTSEHDRQSWLNPAVPPETAASLCAPVEGLRTRPVSRAVNFLRFKSAADCHAPPDPAVVYSSAGKQRVNVVTEYFAQRGAPTRAAQRPRAHAESSALSSPSSSQPRPPLRSTDSSSPGKTAARAARSARATQAVVSAWSASRSSLLPSFLPLALQVGTLVPPSQRRLDDLWTPSSGEARSSASATLPTPDTPPSQTCSPVVDLT